MKKTNAVVLGRLIPNSGKLHQNQEVYSSEGSEIGTIKACHYKDPPKIVVWNKDGNCNEQDYSNRKH